MSARGIIEGRVLEAVEQELAWLAKELQLTPEQQAGEAARNRAHEVFDWAENRDVTLPDTLDRDEPWEAVEWLEANDAASFKDFGEDMLERMHSDATGDEPPWTVLDFRGFVHDDWLVHFSDDAADIFQDGFLYGVDPSDTHRLGLSTWYNDRVRKKSQGFNFAFTAADAARNVGGRDQKYGKYAVIFRASGVRVYHTGDQENQVIFLGRTAHDIVHAYKDDQGNWAVGKRPGGNPIFKTEGEGSRAFDEVVDWVIANHAQYRKALRPARERPVPERRPGVGRRQAA